MNSLLNNFSGPSGQADQSKSHNQPQPSATSQHQQQQQAALLSNNNGGPLILKAPQAKDIIFFNENGFMNTANQLFSYFTSSTYAKTTDTPVVVNNSSPVSTQHQASNPATVTTKPTVKLSSSLLSPEKKSARGSVKKKVKFPEDDRIVGGYSLPPQVGWMPGLYSTGDLLDSYMKSCERNKCRPLAKLVQQLKALQDLDCANGEKVNVLNLKNEKLDSKQMEAMEEIFKRLSFKTIDLESCTFEDEMSAATLFEILCYYDTCEKLIIANARTLGLFGWQELGKYIRKSISIENIDLRGQTFVEFVHFTYLARSIRQTQTLRIMHLEFSNINNRVLVMLAAALKDNLQLKEIYLGDNKMQPNDGHSIASIIKENRSLEVLDLRSNNLQDAGLSYICMGLSEQIDPEKGIKCLSVASNNITASGISYLAKALIHNRSLVSLNVSFNSLTSEAIYELKEGLIVNKQINSLILTRVKLTDEGVIALAEYIAETQSLRRLDLRENDIRLGGLMALASSLKFNKTLDRIELDRDPKKDANIRDSVETSKRLIQDINDYCMRNKRNQIEKEAAEAEALARQQLQYQEQQQANGMNDEIDQSLTTTNDEELCIVSSSTNNSSVEDDIDIIAQDDTLLKRILTKANNMETVDHGHFHSPTTTNGHKRPISPIIEPGSQLMEYFNHNSDDDFGEELIERFRVDDDGDVIRSSVTKCEKKLEKLDLDDDYQASIKDLLNGLIDQIESNNAHSSRSDRISIRQVESSTNGECEDESDIEVLTSSSPLALMSVSKKIEPIVEPVSSKIKENGHHVQTTSTGPEDTQDPYFNSKLTNSQISEELNHELVLSMQDTTGTDDKQ